ncbi:hypothetical protein Pmani_034635 [Petrolisthes manimaculis]|uniref:Uncharacterized protein n=1 Tax=Petrolisthes manimaculis TaxID=1843537 RepID=A0AAE1NM29_9EUCA|nr:hypothetical protein Pmani_034635 [Petrolisthes manimaculis]
MTDSAQQQQQHPGEIDTQTLTIFLNRPATESRRGIWYDVFCWLSGSSWPQGCLKFGHPVGHPAPSSGLWVVSPFPDSVEMSDRASGWTDVGDFFAVLLLSDALFMFINLACANHTRHSCSQEFLDVAEKSITDFLKNSKFIKYPEFLAGSLLSMAILGHYPPWLIKEAYQPQKMLALQGFQRSKPLSRLLMLHEIIKVEQPELYVDIPVVSKKNMPTRTITDELRYRPALATLMEGATVLNDELGSPVFKLTFPVPHFNYVSLVVSVGALQELKNSNIDFVSNSHISKQLSLLLEKHGGNQIAIELLDSNTTLLNTVRPHFVGMVDMKIRIMKKSGWVMKQISEEDIFKCENDAQAVAALILDVLDKTSL